MALGNEAGLVREWPTQWGGDDLSHRAAWNAPGRVPWISLHEAVSRAEQEAAAHGQQGASALGQSRHRHPLVEGPAGRQGRPSPWIAERGVKARGADTSTADLVPPPGVTRLEPGDFVEATIEHVVMPQFAADYYGPNEAFAPPWRPAKTPGA